MSSQMAFVSCIFGLVITMFSQGELQLQQDESLILDIIKHYLAPKNLRITKVKRMDQAPSPNDARDVVILDFIGMVEQYGYPAEEHSVTTEDGYNLKIHRIPGSPLWRNKGKKKVIFIQHGLLGSSETWVLFGPGKDLVYLLADQGYDVWIGNARGNTYCRSHVNLTVYDREFWQFSFHEVGVKDLPAVIDYILNYTGQKSLRYIGHSMGTTELLILLSSKPEYNAKINIAILLSPVAFWPSISSSLKLAVDFAPIAWKFLDNSEIYDVFPQSSSNILLGRMFCSDQSITQVFCITSLFVGAGSDPMQLNTTVLPDILTRFPAGSSVQSFKHYYQNILADDFRNFDYGTVGNLKRYKQETPPKYNIKKITVPTAVFYADNDVLIPKQNVFKLSRYLSNIILMEKVPFQFFNHADYVIAIDAKILLYDRIIQILQEFDANQTLTMQ